MKQKLTMISGFILILLASIALVACLDSDEKSSPEKTKSPPATVTTESGLQYIQIREGTGMATQKGDVVKLHYTGTLEDGTKFDSSVGGEPIRFALGIDTLIPGFTEGVDIMKEGGKARFIIPPELGYGGTQVGTIPPNSTLNFEVELLSVERPDPPEEVATENYKTTGSGLKYYDLSAGNGPAPQTGDFIIMHSAIWRADGTPLGSTFNTGQPQFMVLMAGNLVPGWEEGISNMHTGGKRQMVIPPELAFGAEGIGDIIPPDTTLIIEVELLQVIPVPEPTEQTEVSEEDYMVTDSGLKYYDIRPGSGPLPEGGQTAIVHYTGWLTDGTKFDSSIDHGQPLTFTFGTGQVIPGFEEGIATMQVGGKRQMVIPPELGYQDEKVRIFEVELEYVL